MSQSETIPSNNIIQLEEDEDGNLVIPFPDELLDALNWGEGTEIEVQVIAGSLVFRAID